MKLITWNYRGLGNGPTIKGLLDVQKREDPDVLFLSETRMVRDRLEGLRWKLGMPHMVAKDCCGKGGGLALFWKRERGGCEAYWVCISITHRHGDY